MNIEEIEKKIEEREDNENEDESDLSQTGETTTEENEDESDLSQTDEIKEPSTKTTVPSSSEELNKTHEEKSIQTSIDVNNRESNEIIDLSLADPSIRESKSFNDFTLNLSWNLRNDLIAFLVECSSYLNGINLTIADKRNFANLKNDLMQRMSILATGDDLKEIKENLSLIGENLLEDFRKNDDNLFYEISWSQRNLVIDLLMKNFNLAILFYDLATKKDRVCLLSENYELINLLLTLKVKSLHDDLVKNDKISDDKDINKRPKKKIKTDDRIGKLIEQNNELEKTIKSMRESEKNAMANEKFDLDADEIDFKFKIDNLKDFLESRKEITSDVFYSSSVPFYIRVVSKQLSFLTNYLEFSLHLKLEATEVWFIKTDYTVNLLTANNQGLSQFVKHDELEDFIEDNQLTLELKLKSYKFTQQANESEIIDVTSF